MLDFFKDKRFKIDLKWQKNVLNAKRSPLKER